jgi:hypothetical protein
MRIVAQADKVFPGIVPFGYGYLLYLCFFVKAYGIIGDVPF